MTTDPTSDDRASVLIVGGGIAGLEAMMALRDLARDRVRITLAAPDPDFVYKPLCVEEPFSSQPAEQHALAPIASEFDAEFTQQGVAEVRPDERSVKLADGSSVDYDKLVLCIGARARPAFAAAVPLRTDGTVLPIDSLLRETESSESGVISTRASRRATATTSSNDSGPMPMATVPVSDSSRFSGSAAQFIGTSCLPTLRL